MRRMMALVVPVVIVAAILVGDLSYSCVVEHRCERWERGIERSEEGVRKGCEAFSVGTGEPALLLIHGFADSPALFRRSAARLSAAGFCCRAVRLPGFAEPMAVYRTTGLGAWRSALDKELLTLCNEHEDVWIVGHSLGGTLAVDLALRHPDRVRGVVLLAPLLRVSSARSPLGLPPRLWHRLARCTLHVTEIVENPYGIDAVSPSASAHPHDRFVPRCVYDALFALLDDIHGRADELDMPVLAVLADQDRVIDSEAVEEFVEATASTRKGILYVSDAGHMIPLDAEDQVVKATSDFVLDRGFTDGPN